MRNGLVQLARGINTEGTTAVVALIAVLVLIAVVVIAVVVIAVVVLTDARTLCITLAMVGGETTATHSLAPTGSTVTVLAGTVLMIIAALDHSVAISDTITIKAAEGTVAGTRAEATTTDLRTGTETEMAVEFFNGFTGSAWG
jgi:hypothetical protein